MVLLSAQSDHEPIAISGGADLWKRLQQPSTVAEIMIGLSGREAPESRESIIELFKKLQQLGLLSRPDVTRDAIA